MERRTLLAGLGAVGLGTLSGCLGVVGMDEHESTPGGVDPDALEATGYDGPDVKDVVVRETLEVGPISEDVTVINHLTEYDKSVDIGPLETARAAVFVVLSTPKVGVLGRNVNPVEEMSADELVDLLESNYDDVENVDRDGDDDVTILGQETTQTRFTAEAAFEGTSLDVYVHVSEAVETDDDLLVSIGIYPQELRTEAESNVETLMEGIVADLEAEGPDDGTGDGSSEEGDDEGATDDSDEESGDEDDEASDGENEEDEADDTDEEDEEDEADDTDEEDEEDEADDDGGIGLEIGD